LTTSLPQKLLRNALKQTAVASATSEETRAVLQGVHMTLQDTAATFVATDGRRLAKLDLTLPTGLEGSHIAILPARAVAELQRLLKDTEEPIQFAFAGGTLYASLGATLICARLLEGKFPNYRNLLPASFTTTALVERELFIASVRRALVMAQEKQTPRLIRLNLLETTMELSSSAPDVGAASDSIPMHKSGPDMEIAFNGKFLLDGLQTLTSTEVRLKLNEPTSAAILEPASHTQEYLYLLMPVRIQREEPVPAGAAHG
jgi:DNA polymerase-3 subunit beta